MLEALQTIYDAGVTGNAFNDVVDAVTRDFVILEENRGVVLLAFLRENGSNAEPDEIHDLSDNTFSYGRGEYLVLTDDEADEAATEYIKESLWSFNSDFLASETGLPAEVFKALQDKCEDSNDAVSKLVEATCGVDSFVETAISADGRGNFLGAYDSEENELLVIGKAEFFIYRIN
jgi:hypothetical protein